MWCSVPFPTYPIAGDDDGGGTNSSKPWFPWPLHSTNIPSSFDVSAAASSGSSQSTEQVVAAALSTADAVGTVATAAIALVGSNSTTLSDLATQAIDQPQVLFNFWFFLWFYYGLYNAVALLLITKIFNIYSLNWWPKALGGLRSYFIFWLSTQLMGIVVYYFTGLERFPLTWVSLTFCTMTIPLLVAFLVIRSENRNVYRHSLTWAQKTFLSTSSIESRIPASYVRFLWFCVALAIALSTIVTGQLYADQFIHASKETPPTAIEGLVYVYSWVGTIYILDAFTDYIVETRVRSYPLSSIFKLYYFMIYFIFYRNLFVRLRSYKQFLAIQVASSFWVCIFHPICMTHTVYKALVYLFGITKTYEEYKRQVGRGLFLRNLAENATMLAFLCWVNILYYGPNAKVYPYFQFDDKNPIYKHDITVYASIGIWVSELISNFINRLICKRFLGHHVTKEALKDLKEYPELIVAFVLVMVHILQDMLLSLINLDNIA
ncbi:hypothetical protein EMPS_01282 [Entomortierella parvispora]|uniref:Uncharacterized protein n=1 Tax=Entomortierella parvispora TaxID=205924 RepID=A0A9P3LSE2_9FUNG|nr:hypothetical protein EMPS_01282 [Entomortierella parvispora]